MPLEELTRQKIYSVSKKSENPTQSPSSVYVITNEDLRQMGIMHWAEALRTVPGLHVARLNANKWMVTSRGFSEQFSNKLLVLIDGRVVYSPLFSGVFWDQQDIPLEDIKQIEVIRGPGATIWGANAVNGIINVITKHSKETQGNFVSTLASTNGDRILSGYSGHQTAESGYYRAFAKLRDSGDYPAISARSYDDGWKFGRAGFRYDQALAGKDSLNVQGELFKGAENQYYNLPSLSAPFTVRDEHEETFKGGNISAKWQHSISPDTDLNLHAYLDYNDRDLRVANVHVGIADIEAQVDTHLNERHTLSIGGGYRFITDWIENTPYLIYTPDNRITHVVSAFVQDEIALVPHTLFLTLGSKVEYNSYSDIDFQPSAKLAWHIDKHNMLWAGVSRALRTPSRGTQDLSLQVVGTGAGYMARVGNPRFDPEELIAYEIGFKTTEISGLTADITAFYNQYDKLRTFQLGPSAGINNVGFPFNISNGGSAGNLGFEAAAKYYFTPRHWVSAAYTYFRPDLSLDSNVVDNVFLTDAGRSPKQQLAIRSSYKMLENVTLNNSLYSVGRLHSINIDSYLRYDANIVFNISDNADLTIAALNMFDSRHQEFSAPLYGDAAEVPRTLYAQVSLHF